MTLIIIFASLTGLLAAVVQSLLINKREIKDKKIISEYHEQIKKVIEDVKHLNEKEKEIYKS